MLDVFVCSFIYLLRVAWFAAADEFAPTHVVSLGAQAGVRFSLEAPRGVHRRQRDRLSARARVLPTRCAACAAHLRVVVVGLRSQPENAV